MSISTQMKNVKLIKSTIINQILNNHSTQNKTKWKNSPAQKKRRKRNYQVLQKLRTSLKTSWHLRLELYSLKQMEKTWINMKMKWWRTQKKHRQKLKFRGELGLFFPLLLASLCLFRLHQGNCRSLELKKVKLWSTRSMRISVTRWKIFQSCSLRINSCFLTRNRLRIGSNVKLMIIKMNVKRLRSGNA